MPYDSLTFAQFIAFYHQLSIFKRIFPADYLPCLGLGWSCCDTIHTGFGVGSPDEVSLGRGGRQGAKKGLRVWYIARDLHVFPPLMRLALPLLWHLGRQPAVLLCLFFGSVRLQGYRSGIPTSISWPRPAKGDAAAVLAASAYKNNEQFQIVGPVTFEAQGRYPETPI